MAQRVSGRQYRLIVVGEIADLGWCGAVAILVNELYGGNGSGGEVKMQRVDKRLRRDGCCSSIAREVDKKGVSNEARGYGLFDIAGGST